MKAIALDSPELRELGREAARHVGAEQDGGPLAYCAKDERSSLLFLIVDGAGARHAADFLNERHPSPARASLCAELIVASQEEP